jgi:hypothetical protein
VPGKRKPHFCPSTSVEDESTDSEKGGHRNH